MIEPVETSEPVEETSTSLADMGIASASVVGLMTAPATSAARLGMAPSVGRVVWFWPSEALLIGKGAQVLDPDQPFAATVAMVHENGDVALSVVDHYGCQFNVAATPMDRAGDRLPAPSAQWMPYQMAQATKGV